MTGLFTNDQKAGYLDPQASGTKVPVRQVVAVYNTNQSAHVARDGLLAAGIPAGAIHVIDRADPTTRTANSIEVRRKAFWDIVTSLFWPSEDPAAYHLGADPDHAVLVLQPGPKMDVRRALQILRSSHPFYVFPAVDEDGAALQP